MTKDHKPINAIFFDLDGTVVNNTPLHYEAWRILSQEHGRELTPEIYRTDYDGKNTASVLSEVWKSNFDEDEAARVYTRKAQIYSDLMEEYDLSMEGFADFFDSIVKCNIATALVSNATSTSRDLTLEKVGMHGMFNHVIGPEAGLSKKPAPDMYKHAALLVGVDPAECLVFEDSPVGVESALRAGMRVIAIGDTHSKSDLVGAEFCVPDFSLLQVNSLRSGVYIDKTGQL